MSQSNPNKENFSGAVWEHVTSCMYKGDGNTTRRSGSVTTASGVAEGEMMQRKTEKKEMNRRRLAWEAARRGLRRGGGAGVSSSLLTATAEGETVHDDHTFHSPRPTNM